MQSRTPEGKHTKRFIVLKRTQGDETFTRSFSVPGFYATKEEAQQAIVMYVSKNPDVQYKIRQK